MAAVVGLILEDCGDHLVVVFLLDDGTTREVVLVSETAIREVVSSLN